MSMVIDWKAMYEADEKAIESLESAIASKDAALALAVEALDGWRRYAEEILADDPYANVQWPQEDTDALEACRKAMEP